MAAKTLVNNPDSAEREYVRDLRRYARELAAAVERILIPLLPSIVDEYRREARADAWTDSLRGSMNELARQAAIDADPRIQRLPGRFNVVSKFNDAQIAMIAKANTGLALPSVQVGAPVSRLLGVNVFRNEPFLAPMAEGWVKVNTDLIKSLPTRLHPELEGIIQRGVMNGASVKQLRDQIRARYGVTNYRATLIAQDQTLKLNAALTRSRLESLGVKQYTWRSVQDSRVRAEHADLNGKAFSFDKPPSEGNPGTPVRCRCRAEAVWPSDDVVDVPAAKVARKPRAPKAIPVAPAPELTPGAAARSRLSDVALEYSSKIADASDAGRAAETALAAVRAQMVREFGLTPSARNAQNERAAALVSKEEAHRMEIIAADTRKSALQTEKKQKAIEALYHSKADAEGSLIKGSVPRSIGGSLKVSRATALVSKIVAPDRWPNVSVGALAGKRAYYSYGRIFIGPDTTVSVVAHEIVHDLEYRYPWILDAARNFLFNRARGEAPKSLKTLTGNSGYGPAEVAYEDDWKRRGGTHYTGKVYPNSTEVLTTGFERLIADPIDFAQKDPEFFDFLLDTFQGKLPPTSTRKNTVKK